MTRRSDKQDAGKYWVPDGQQSTVWACYDMCDLDCSAEGVNIVALFTNEQTARQFADKRRLSVTSMRVYSSMKGI
ncbi:MAG TPA: hypothetical protein VHL57_03770 [Flavobacteriales bacterium]|jgi:hypothetical protein|nr:hypothetical protein [Flavobacteriales bacterium]